MASETDSQAVVATYTAREVAFVVDESSTDLGQKNRDDGDFNRAKLTQRDLAGLSVISSLTKVEYGKWGREDACLIVFRFQFQKGNATLFRFEHAEIVVEFLSRPPSHPDNDPRVLKYGPKRLQSTGTPEDRSWHCNVALSASAGGAPLPIQGGPTLEFGNESNYTRQYAAEIESDDWGNRKHRYPNCLKIWMREDQKQKKGIPLELLAAVVVQTSGPFQAYVNVKVDSIFNLVAWPWSKDDALLLQPGVDFGAPLRTPSAFDFSTLTLDEWRQLVTPDLHFK
ncbi:hypothetical protein F4677DRAFT_354104 [Hypoxylon crocopeplum]|nr:hypothetical protein F4677DRAFT_354104 [Hypoxylon crocopeplum]